jgi:redox-sensitive bicupin YhaK (pirin superfamily)
MFPQSWGMEREVERVEGPFPAHTTEQVDRNILLVHFDERHSTDPFLLLSEDWFSRVGFDWHPHRGFETVTYVIDGHLEHRDNAGGHGVLGPGDLQWVTTGRGIIHAELAYDLKPVHTLQLWLNLPAAKKMVAPRYQDLRAANVPEIREPGSNIRVYSGVVRGVRGPAENYWDATVIDGRFERGGAFVHEVPAEQRLFLYVIAGAVQAGSSRTRVTAGQVAWFAPGGTTVHIQAEEPSRIVAYAAQPIGEPVVARGPFVMNTPAEIQQALIDFRRGAFGPAVY